MFILPIDLFHNVYDLPIGLFHNVYEDLQHSCLLLNPAVSAEDELSAIQKQFPKFFSATVVSTKQLLRLLQMVHQHLDMQVNVCC